MRSRLTSLAALVALSLAAACNCGTKPPPGASPDAGSKVDAGTKDAGTSDAGTADAGTTDAGTTDAGTADAGTTDAGTGDAGAADGGAQTATGYRIDSLPASVTAGTAATFTLTAIDATGAAVTGYAGTVHFTSTDGTAALPADYAFQPSDNGAHAFSATFTAAGTPAITATDTADSTITATSSLSVTAAAAASLVLVSGDGQAATAGSAVPLPLVVAVYDAFSNPVAGATVGWAVTTGAGSVSAASSTTAADGTASITATLSTVAGANTFAATAAGLTGSPVTFSATGTAGAATQLLLISGNGQTGTAGTQLAQPLVVAAEDQFGNGVAGIAVDFASANGGSVNPASALTDSAGLASTAATLGGGAGAQSFTASNAGLANSPVTFGATATAGAPASIALVSGDGQTGTAGFALANALVVKVSDQFGNAVAGYAVSWAATSGGGSISPASSATDAAGLASATATLGPTAGADAYAASGSGLAGSPVAFGATGVAANPSNIALVSGDNQSAAAGSAFLNPLVVKVTDPNGNPVAGVAVAWAAVTGGGAVSPASSTTNASGLAQATATAGSSAGAEAFSAASGGLTGSPVSFAETATAGGATTLAITGGNGQSGVAGTQLPQALVVKVTDGFGNPVQGVTVGWAVTLGAGSLSAATTSTAADGTASVMATLDKTAGANGFTATAPGLTGSPATFNATGTAGPAAQLTKVSGDNQSGAVNTALANPLVVKVTDANGNAVSGVTVSWGGTSGGGSVNPFTATTNGSGLAQTTATLGTLAGADTFAASAGAITGSPATFSATATAGAPANLTRVSGDSQTGAAGSALANALVVRVTDQFGNPVGGTSVTFAPPAGGAVNPANATTAADGTASSVATLPTAAGAVTYTASKTGVTGSPVFFPETAVAGPASQLVKVSGDGQIAIAGAALANPLVVAVEDQYGNPVSGTTVNWSAVTAGGGVSPASGTSGANGQVSTTATLGASVGPYSYTASASGLAGSPQTFTETASSGPAADLVYVSGDAQSGTAGSTLAAQLVVKVTDASGNAVSGTVVTWAVAQGLGGVSPATSTTGANGQAATTATLDKKAGTNKFTASVTGLAGSPVIFTETGVAGPAATLAMVSGNNQTAQVGTQLAQPLVVLVSDANGNPVSGFTVGWSASPGASITPASGTSGANGQASATATVSQTAGANTFTATASGLAGSPQGFAATGAPGPATQLVTVSGNNQSGAAGGALGSPFVVAAKDAFGNGVAGVTVAWSAASGGGSVSPASSTTGANGQASSTGTLGAAAGTNTFTATSGTLAGSPQTFTATGVAGAAAKLVYVSGNNQTGTAGSALASPLVVEVEDVNNNPVSGFTVSWAAVTAGALVSAATTTTSASGLAQVTATLAPTAGADGYTATAAGLANSPFTFSATGLAGPAAKLVYVSGSGQSGTAGSALANPLVVEVEDANNNPVSGTPVTFATSTPGASVSPASATSNASGLAQTAATLSTTAGTNAFTASSGTLTGSPVSFTATGNAGPASAIAIFSGNGQSGTAGSTLANPLVVTITDANGNAVSGATVNWARTAGNGSITPASSTTGANGQTSATATLGTTAGTNTFTATSGTLTGSPQAFTETGVAGPPTQLLYISGNSQSGTVNTALAPFVVEVADANNNPVSGVTVNWARTGGNGSITPASSTTGANGQTSATATLGTAAGANTFTATSGTLTGSPMTFTATGTAGAAAKLAISSGNNQSGVAGSALASPLVALVTDAFNNPVSGTTVAWAATTLGASVSPGSSVSNTSGLAQTSATLAPTAGTNTFTATSGTLTGSPLTFTATGTAGAATTMIMVSGNNQAATVNTALAAPLVVQVNDASSNPVAGVTVTWAVASGGGSVTALSATTGANGQASASATVGKIAGANSFTASSPGLVGSPQTFAATGLAGAATQLVMVSGNGQSGTAGTTLASALVVAAQDQYGNGVSGVTVGWARTGGNGSITPASGTTGANGQTSATATLGTTAGTNTFTATSGTLAGSPQTFTETGVAGPAATLLTLSGNGQTGTVNATLAAFVVEVVDANNNPVSGVTVNWARTGGNGSITPASSTTGANGQTSATATLGTTAGANSFTATSGTLTGSPQTFTATGVAGPATQLVMISGNNQTTTVGLTLAAPFVVAAEDQYGNGVSGVTVNWARTGGNGSITPASSTTVANGQTSATATAGTTAGTNTFTATSGTLAGSPQTFTATGTAGTATTLAKVSGDAQSGAVGTTLPAPLVVLVTDAFANPVSGVTIGFAAASGGGSVAPVSAVTGANGQAQTTATLGAVAGSDTYTASNATLTPASVTFTETATAAAAGLVYTNPSTTGKKIALLNDAASTSSVAVLDLVALVPLTGYSVGMNLPLNVNIVQLDATPMTPGTALNPGTTVVAAKTVLPTSGPLSGVWVSGQSQKAAGAGAVTTDTAVAANTVLYTIRLDLKAGAPLGTVFDGATLGAAFRGAFRDKQGNDLAVSADYAIGKLANQ